MTGPATVLVGPRIAGRIAARPAVVSDPFRRAPISSRWSTSVLRQWQERATFARLRAQNAGGPHWSFLDGPITANNPMGVHHAWGRTYKDVFQRYHAMLGKDQRWQNGFDCQGLWVEVNVERDLGFKSKRDIEAYGIAEFVSLCKQRVLTYAARQTEQSIRLGMWMDWNDPDELRRLRDLLGAPTRGRSRPSRARTGRSRTPSRCSSGGSACPTSAGRYFTFSNENNDLIWGFLKECHKRGWIYKGHDSMPWCPRCGTGISQHEMTEGYAGPRGPGSDGPLPARRPAGRVRCSSGRRRRGRSPPTSRPRSGRTSSTSASARATPRYWVGKGTLKRRVSGPFEVLESKRRAASSSAGATRARSTTCRRSARRSRGTRTSRRRRTSTASSPWTEVGEDEGTGIVHIAPGAGAEDFQLGKALGLPVIGPIDEDGRYYAGLRLAHRHEAAARGRGARSSTTSSGAASSTTSSRTPTATRTAGGAARRCCSALVDEWFISMGQVYDKPRAELTKEEVDASLRYQIMDVVDQIRWIPSFGYERELDWLTEHARLDDQQEALLGPGAADLRLPELRHVRRDRRARGARGAGARRLGAVRGPHAAPAVRRRGHDRAAPAAASRSTRIPDVGNPWLDAGIVPFSTLHFREDREYWEKWFPADFITESFPGQFRNWFYAMLAMSTVLRARAAVQDDLRLRHAVRRGRPADAQELGQLDRVRRGRRAHGRRRHALDVHLGAARGQHPLRLARGRRGAARAARAVERRTRSS